ncbi:Alpha/Beta hydrolase protein [Desarmillaria tabescens]|uniref:Alpha/Beta hydrolase protein n=1 Tax=Armillaria tabescens TaxID=1929756 RepID=A0AA39K1Z1_ARMTA|nr:Alpha/Beta hydrolase protein [Desarmillaria tabescens]KAK0453014.1 Alpha/Beta hydrolase protein [Desarmillaria tabescens]
MDKVAELQQKDVPEILFPTVGIFLPLLEAKREKIQETSKRTFQYGATERHKLHLHHQRAPLLFFSYGGGFDTGARALPPPADLVYANLGSYFSSQGFITIIPDYRLVPAVQHPGAAQDVRDAMQWAIDNPENLAFGGATEPDLDALFVMGHSAGAMNVFTILISPELYSATLHPRIKGAVLFAGAYTFEEMPGFMSDAVEQYYGPASVEANGDSGLEHKGTHQREKLPLGLLQAATEEKMTSLPKLLLGIAERDPDSLINASKNFQLALEARGLTYDKFVAAGHNHISVNFAVGTGQGEEWAEDVVKWIRSV